MLKQRLITGLILAAIVAFSIVALPTIGFGVILSIFILLGAWEWGGLLFPPAGQWCYCAGVAALIGLVWSLLERPLLVAVLMALSGAYWCWVVFWLWRYTMDAGRNSVFSWALAGLLTLVPTWVALMTLHGRPTAGPFYVLFLVALIAGADSSAYFVGRRWGRHKLAPRLSPGKTREGVIGALVAAAVLALAGGALLGIAPRPAFLALCLATVAFSIVGDLFESMFKRQHAAKDSSSLLPGHGGMLDRLDSMTAAAPVFLLGLLGLTR